MQYLLRWEDSSPWSKIAFSDSCSASATLAATPVHMSRGGKKAVQIQPSADGAQATEARYPSTSSTRDPLEFLPNSKRRESIASPGAP